jgi:hypothetical protein
MQTDRQNQPVRPINLCVVCWRMPSAVLTSAVDQQKTCHNKHVYQRHLGNSARLVSR